MRTIKIERNVTSDRYPGLTLDSMQTEHGTVIFVDPSKINQLLKEYGWRFHSEDDKVEIWREI